VLAVVENGTYDDGIPFLDFFRSNLDGYIQKTINMYNNINEEDIIVALEEVKEFEQQTADTGRTITYANAYQYLDNTGSYVRTGLKTPRILI
jgi:tRNA splicing endonuclease